LQKLLALLSFSVEGDMAQTLGAHKGAAHKGATREAKGAEAPPPPLSQVKFRKKIISFNF